MKWMRKMDGLMTCALAGVVLLAANACGSSNDSRPTGGGGGSDGGTGSSDASGTSSDGGFYDAGLTVGPGINPCSSVNNAPGTVASFNWPNAMNDGNNTFEDQTISFDWTSAGASSDNLVQLEGWWGQSGSVLGTSAAGAAKFANANWPNELYSPPLAAGGSYKWNTGDFPCGWRPGLYYLGDQAKSSITVWSITVPEKSSGGDPNPDFAPKKCSMLSDPKVYEARYAAYAGRPNCMQYEVNNFQTNSGYDWVSPTYGVNQGDLVLFRWTGLHNVIQVHDQSQDEPVDSGGINSGARSNCVGGPNYTCANGSLDLGEYMIDTTSYRPGMVHLSDQCAYSACQSCQTFCDSTKTPNYAKGTGTSQLLFVQRPVRPAPPVVGGCCAIPGFSGKGQACRVVDLYNDNDGLQFDTGLGGGVTVNRGDIIRFRWGGFLKIAQTTPKDAAGDSSTTLWAGGQAMTSSVECVPGPNWTCLGGNTDDAVFYFDVDKAMSAATPQYTTFSYGQHYFNFWAFGDNSNDPYNTMQDSPIMIPVDQDTAYATNPSCP